MREGERHWEQLGAASSCCGRCSGSCTGALKQDSSVLFTGGGQCLLEAVVSACRWLWGGGQGVGQSCVGHLGSVPCPSPRLPSRWCHWTVKATPQRGSREWFPSFSLFLESFGWKCLGTPSHFPKGRGLRADRGLGRGFGTVSRVRGLQNHTAMRVGDL